VAHRLDRRKFLLDADISRFDTPARRRAMSPLPPVTTTKRDLVARIAAETKLSKVAVKAVVQRFLDSIIDELRDGHRLEFRDFGIFEVKERPQRRAQNPRTLEKVLVPPKRVVKFKVGREMRERVCAQAAPPPAKRATTPAPRTVVPTPPPPPPKPVRPVPPPPNSNSPF